MTTILTLLGTGDAAQLPVFGCGCASCERANQNAFYSRGPCSALLEVNQLHILIDSGLTDLAQRFKPGELSHIFQTHYHADHVQGLLHFRWGIGSKIPVYGPIDAEGFSDLYKHPGMLAFQPGLSHGDTIELTGLSITPLALNHSKPTLGYLLQTADCNIAYLTDTVGLPEISLRFLSAIALDCLVIDCSHPPQAEPPRNHNDLNLVQAIVARLNCKEILLTHISHQMDLWQMQHPKQLPRNYKIARDNMIRTFAAIG